MFFKNKIRLFWWNEKVFHNKAKENYGDLLGKYLAEKISGKQVVFTKPKDFTLLDFFSPIYVTIGSILGNVNHKCIVWGSGIITKNQEVKKAKEFLAVRGPQTRFRLLELGYQVPEVYGDPALLLPDFYNPIIEKEFEIGIVPHYVDYEQVKMLFQDRNDVFIVDLMTNDIETTTMDFLKCRKIVSSSLHGLIISHTYGIPAIWQKFSDKVYGDDIKFQDYFESVQMEFYQPMLFNKDNLNELFVSFPVLPKKEVVQNLKKGLMEVCPFVSK